MSGEFRDEQNVSIEATDDPELAKRHGLTQFDKATGQWRAPQPPDAGQRDGADVQEQQHAAALAEGDAQHEADLKAAEDAEAKRKADEDAEAKRKADEDAAAAEEAKAKKTTGTKK